MRNRNEKSGFMILIGFICLSALSFCLLQALYSNGLVQKKIEYQSKSDYCLYQTTAHASRVTNAVGYTNRILKQLKNLNKASYMVDVFFPGYGKTIRMAAKKAGKLIVRFQDLSIRLFDLSKHFKTLLCSRPLTPYATLDHLGGFTKRPRAGPNGQASPLFWKNSKRPEFKVSIFHKDFLIATHMTIARQGNQKHKRRAKREMMIQEGYSPQYL